LKFEANTDYCSNFPRSGLPIRVNGTFFAKFTAEALRANIDCHTVITTS